MMTPQAASETEVMEYRQKQFHLALFRLRLLLSMDEKVKTVQVEKEGETAVGIVSSENEKKLRPHLQEAYPEVAFSRSSSLYSVELDEEIDVHQQEWSEERNNNSDNNNDNSEEEDSVIPLVIPLPSLLWPIPTRQERLEAMEARHQKRRKQGDYVTREGWLCGGSLAAIVRSGGVPPVVSTAAAAPTTIDTITSTDGGDKNAPVTESNDTSSLTMTADRSDRCSSQDTYATHNASHDDVYIHELAREHGSISTPTNTTTTTTTNTHVRQLSASISVSGRRQCGLLGPHRTDPVLVAALLSSDSTVANTQTEFDRIGSGKAEPYTSYLFSPYAKILDLNTLALSVTDNSDSSSGGKREKDGCTCVCFSPEENCYIIGTQQGGLWFMQIETQGGATSSNVNNTHTTNAATTTNNSITSNASNTSAKPLMLQGHSAAIMDIVFNNAGTFFASAGADACVILWNKQTRLKVRRINTDGGIPASVHFMPKNNNYLLVSLPQQHLLRLYNTSTGLPVTRKAVAARVEVTAVAVEPCADPFLFVGDANGTITMWRYRVSSSDATHTLPPVIMEQTKGVVHPLPRYGRDTERRRVLIQSIGQQLSKKPQHQHPIPLMVESQPHFVKMGSLTLEKGKPVGTLVVSSMNHRQFRSLLHVQRVAQLASEKREMKNWRSTAFTGMRQHNGSQIETRNTDTASSVRIACGLMLLASFPCDRLVIVCVQPGNSTPREYKLVPMLVINGASRIRQLSAGTAFCVDNTRCPTVSCTCEEGFVHIITCNTASSALVGDARTRKKPFQDYTSTLWSVIASLPVPSGGIPCSLAWSPDMRFLVTVTEEGTVYQWQRVNPLQGQQQQQQQQQQQRRPQEHEVSRSLTHMYNREYSDLMASPQALDEVDEWRIYLKMEKERQMRRYRTERRAADPLITGGGSGDSLSGSDSWWSNNGNNSISRSSGRG